MGVCCEATNQSVELKDLPERESSSGDMIEMWEVALPFSRCTFFTYEHLMQLAH